MKSINSITSTPQIGLNHPLYLDYFLRPGGTSGVSYDAMLSDTACVFCPLDFLPLPVLWNHTSDGEVKESELRAVFIRDEMLTEELVTREAATRTAAQLRPHGTNTSY